MNPPAAGDDVTAGGDVDKPVVDTNPYAGPTYPSVSADADGVANAMATVIAIAGSSILTFLIFTISQ
jgi:hypothetical protein